MKRRLAAIALLLALAAPLRADRIAVAVTVTNAPTHGLTFTLNGSTRTWTTNSPSSTQMRISATNSVSATNFYASLAANPFSGRVTIAQTSSNTVTMYGADGQAMVASLPSTSWGFYTATTNATSPGFVTRADYSTAANTASNATDALALALTNGFVKATITNGLVTAGVTNGLTGAAVTNGILSSAKSYTDGATNGTVASANVANLASLASLASNTTWTADTQDPSGWISNDGLGTYTVTNLGASISLVFTNAGSAMKFYRNGSVSNVFGVSATIPTNRATYFIYYRNSDGTLTVSNGAWQLSDVQIATVYADTNGAPIAVRESHGVMPWQTHRRFHSDPSLGAAYVSGFTFATNGGSRGAIFASGTFFDEDILHAAGSTTNFLVAYRDGSSGYMTYRGPRATPFVTNSVNGSLQYDASGTLTDVSALGGGDYANVWFYAFPNIDTNSSIAAVIGQTSGGLSTVQAESPPSLLPGFFAQEAILLARATYRNASPITFIEWTDYRQSKLSGGSTVSGASGTYSNANVVVVNGVVSSVSSGKGYIDGATNALASSADVYRMWFRASAATVTASNVWAFNPYGINVSSIAGLMPLPARYRYIKKATIIVSGLERLSETNWLTPTFKFVKVDGYDIGDNASAPYMETDHGTANSFAGTFNSWTNMPASAWVRTNYASVSSRVGVIWTTTNSITLPANWWTNANASLSASFWLQRLSLINANSITMSNGVAPEAYVEFSTVP